MIDFDFEKEFKQDFEIPLNSASLDSRLKGTQEWNKCISDHFNAYAESYFHAGDIIFKHYMNFLNSNEYSVPPIYEINMFGVIWYLYHHALEMKLKSFLYRVNYEPKNTHKLMNHVEKLNKFYYVPNELKQYIEEFEKHSNGSQTGRYPIDSKNNIIGKEDDGYIVIGGKNGGIATMVYRLHIIFKDIFPNLQLKDPFFLQ